jgi:hypothetical protein
LAEGLQARGKDIYGIKIEAGQDGALIVAMALCIDEIVRTEECMVKSNIRGAPPSDSPLNTFAFLLDPHSVRSSLLHHVSTSGLVFLVL